MILYWFFFYKIIMKYMIKQHYRVNKLNYVLICLFNFNFMGNYNDLFKNYGFEFKKHHIEPWFK